MDIAINVYVWNHKDYRNPNQKKNICIHTHTHTYEDEAVRAQTYVLQENWGKK